jgi:hypothetical protein
VKEASMTITLSECQGERGRLLCANTEERRDEFLKECSGANTERSFIEAERIR